MDLSTVEIENKQIWEFENVKSCMICDFTEQQGAIGVSWEGIGFSYCYCKNCGHKYMNPRPTTESYQQYYISNYWQERMTAKGYATGTAYDDPNINQLELRMHKYRRAFEKVKRDISSTMNISKDTKILEVGCAFGFTLEWLKRDFDCMVYGIEPSALSVKRCKEGGVPVIGSTAESFFYDEASLKEENKFDVIFYRHVLAQIVDVKTLVIRMKEFLAKDGILIIYTPNNYYFSLTDPYHVNIFTPESMGNFMGICGYEVVKSIHAATPINRKAAIEAQPNYEIVCFAKPSNNMRFILKKTEPFEVVKREKLGQQSLNWNNMTNKDMLRMFIKRLKAKFF